MLVYNILGFFYYYKILIRFFGVEKCIIVEDFNWFLIFLKNIKWVQKKWKHVIR